MSMPHWPMQLSSGREDQRSISYQTSYYPYPPRNPIPNNNPGAPCPILVPLSMIMLSQCLTQGVIPSSAQHSRPSQQVSGLLYLTTLSAPGYEIAVAHSLARLPTASNNSPKLPRLSHALPLGQPHVTQSPCLSRCRLLLPCRSAQVTALVTAMTPQPQSLALSAKDTYSGFNTIPSWLASTWSEDSYLASGVGRLQGNVQPDQPRQKNPTPPEIPVRLQPQPLQLSPRPSPPQKLFLWPLWNQY